MKNTAKFLTEKSIQITTKNDKLGNDIVQFNNWLTKIIELKKELKTATFDVLQIVSEFTFFFWLDILGISMKTEKKLERHIEEIQKLNQDLFNVWDFDNFSQHFESILKIISDSLSYIIGLDRNLTIIGQGQSGSTTLNYTKSVTSTSRPKEIQTYTSIHLNQKSTIRPHKSLTSNIFGFHNNANYDRTNFTDTEENELYFDHGLPRNNQSNQTNQADLTELNNTKPSYQHNKPVNNHIHQHNDRNNQKVSPPLPMHPPPVRPLLPVEDITTNNNRMQQRVQQRWFERNSSHIRPNNLRFPYTLTPRSNNKKSFFHQSTIKQSRTSTVSERSGSQKWICKTYITHIAVNKTLYSHIENGLICHLNLKCTIL